jgi:hypothetical protein
VLRKDIRELLDETEDQSNVARWNPYTTGTLGTIPGN